MPPGLNSPHPRHRRSRDDVFHSCQNLRIINVDTSNPLHSTGRLSVSDSCQSTCWLAAWGWMVTQWLAQRSIMRRCGVVSCLLSSAGLEVRAADCHNGPPRGTSHLPRSISPTGSPIIKIRTFHRAYRPVVDSIMIHLQRFDCESRTFSTFPHRLENSARRLPSPWSHRR